MYQGQFKRNKKARGEAVFAEGNVYKGMYKDDRRHGLGSLPTATATATRGYRWAECMGGENVLRRRRRGRRR